MSESEHSETRSAQQIDAKLEQYIQTAKRHYFELIKVLEGQPDEKGALKEDVFIAIVAGRKKATDHLSLIFGEANIPRTTALELLGLGYENWSRLKNMSESEHPETRSAQQIDEGLEQFIEKEKQHYAEVTKVIDDQPGSEGELMEDKFLATAMGRGKETDAPSPIVSEAHIPRETALKLLELGYENWSRLKKI